MNRIAVSVFSCSYYMFIDFTFPGAAQYCFPAKRHFNASCGPREVILMTHAVYGPVDTVGCSADVLLNVDRKCSGRHDCTINIPDPDLHELQPCDKNKLACLEATYQCVSGIRLFYLQTHPRVYTPITKTNISSTS